MLLWLSNEATGMHTSAYVRTRQHTSAYADVWLDPRIFMNFAGSVTPATPARPCAILVFFFVFFFVFLRRARRLLLPVVLQEERQACVVLYRFFLTFFFNHAAMPRRYVKSAYSDI